MSRQSRGLTLQVLVIATLLAVGLLLLSETRRADGATTPAEAAEPSANPAVAATPAPARSVAVVGAGGIGTALVGGWASWYDDPRKDGRYAAAGPLIRQAIPDWRGKTIRVTSGNRSTLVVLSDACACGDRHDWPTLLDLSPTAFSDLAPLHQGIVMVEIELVTLPATDTPDQSGCDPPEHPDDRRMREEVRDDELYAGPRVTAPPTDWAP